MIAIIVILIVSMYHYASVEHPLAQGSTCKCGGPGLGRAPFLTLWLR